MKKLLVALVATAALSGPALALSLSTSNGPPVTPAQFNVTYTFSPGNTGPFPTSGGQVQSGTTSGLYAQPLGSAAPYYSVGPSTTNPVTIAYASNWGSEFYLFWGSVDNYNAIELLDSSGMVIDTVTGSDATDPMNATGNQTSFDENRNVTVSLTAGERAAVTSLRFRSDFGGTAQNAFEFDNFSVTTTAVPEPATWGMMILGFGLIGAAMRRSRRVTPVLA